MASEREPFKVDSLAPEEGDGGQILGGISNGAIGILPPPSLLTYLSVTSLVFHGHPLDVRACPKVVAHI